MIPGTIEATGTTALRCQRGKSLQPCRQRLFQRAAQGRSTIPMHARWQQHPVQDHRLTEQPQRTEAGPRHPRASASAPHRQSASLADIPADAAPGKRTKFPRSRSGWRWQSSHPYARIAFHARQQCVAGLPKPHLHIDRLLPPSGCCRCIAFSQHFQAQEHSWATPEG